MLFYSTIKIANKYLFFKSWSKNGLNFIGGLISENNFLSYEDFCTKYGFRPAMTLFYCLRNAIISVWPSLLKTSNIDGPFTPLYFREITKVEKGSRYMNDVFITLKINYTKQHQTKWQNSLQIPGNLNF